MARQGKREYVSFKSVRLPFYPHGSYWRFAFPDDTVKGGWRYGTRASKKDAKEAAHRKAVEIANGTLDLANLEDKQKQVLRAFLDTSPTLSDIEQFIEWKKQAECSITLEECVSLYTDAKQTSGVSAIYLKRLKGNLRKLVNDLPGKTLHDINLEMLESWFNSNYKSMAAKTRNNIRATLVGLWKWARLRQYLDDAITPPERLPTARVMRKQPPTLGIDQAVTLIENVKPEYLGWLVMCGWGGCRTEEVCPHPDSAKSPLDWCDFHWEKGIIILRAETAKTREKRIIPINEVIIQHLKPIAKKKGRVVDAQPPSFSGHNSETKRLGELVGGWKKNWLRNSYISYRGSIIGLAKTSMEAGNSESECRRSYNDAVQSEDANKWFSIGVISDVES